MSFGEFLYLFIIFFSLKLIWDLVNSDIYLYLYVFDIRFGKFLYLSCEIIKSNCNNNIIIIIVFCHTAFSLAFSNLSSIIIYIIDDLNK